MTVCVAAICKTNIVIGASDRMLTAGDVEFEPDTRKIYDITNSIAVMIAGEASLQMDILQRLWDYVKKRITADPATCADVVIVVDFALVEQPEAKMEKTFRVASPRGRYWDVQPLPARLTIAKEFTCNRTNRLLAFLEFETGLSRHTIVRARRGQPVHARSLQLLKNVVRRVPVRK